MSTDRRPDEPWVDEVVDRAWRATARAEPPARIDAAILESARAEALRTPEPRPAPARRWQWTRWQPLAAAAGVVGLAFVLVQLMPRDEAPQAPAPAADSAPLVGPTPVPTPPPAPVAARGPAAGADIASALDQPAGPTDQSAEAPEVSGAAQRGVAASAGALPARESALPTAEAWARRVADLYAAGDADAASAALEAFRAAYPDADEFLPAELRPWASTVPAGDDQ
jgi:hypothetical protein